MMSLTRNGTVLMLFAFLFAAPVIADGQAERPFSFSITAPSEVKSGSAVLVEITITNTSDSVIGLPGMEMPYVVAVQGPDGKASAETEKGRKVRAKQREILDANFIGSGPLFQLKPGESITNKCKVNDLYDMSRPGEYSIRLERISNRGAMPSNTVKVKITP